jgi:hypothetical protein
MSPNGAEEELRPQGTVVAHLRRWKWSLETLQKSPNFAIRGSSRVPAQESITAP